jgi:hypothetical protein
VLVGFGACEPTPSPQDRLRLCRREPAAQAFDAFNLELRYHIDAHEILIRITIKQDALPAIAARTNEITDPSEPRAPALIRYMPFFRFDQML